MDSHHDYRYSYRHPHSPALHRCFRCGFSARATLPYHTLLGASSCDEASRESIHGVGHRLNPRYIVGAARLDQ